MGWVSILLMVIQALPSIFKLVREAMAMIDEMKKEQPLNAGLEKRNLKLAIATSNKSKSPQPLHDYVCRLRARLGKDCKK